jgi:hypothetical protein
MQPRNIGLMAPVRYACYLQLRRPMPAGVLFMRTHRQIPDLVVFRSAESTGSSINQNWLYCLPHDEQLQKLAGCLIFIILIEAGRC